MIKVLVLDVENAGVGKYRFKDPHICLQKNHKEEFEVDILTNPPLEDNKFLSNYDMVFGQGTLLIKDDIYKIFRNIKKQGLKIVLDLDDYWRVPMQHAMYRKMEQSWKIMTSRLKIADMITTTTKFLAAEIKRYNPNVAVIPNAINPQEKQFQPNVIESDRVRVGYSGGSSHLEDLKLIRGVAGRIRRLSVDTQMVLCGFNNLSRDVQTGKTTTVKHPEVWMRCEQIFTDGYNVNDDYLHYLLHPREEQYKTVDEQPYKRIWTRPIQTYGSTYNEFDIALAPLLDNKFNKMKSQLKLIEAGFHKKPIICSDIAPYRIDGIHEKNCLMVPERKSHKLWHKYVTKLILNENQRKDLGEALYETVSKRYDLNNVTAKRAQVYKSLM